MVIIVVYGIKVASRNEPSKGAKYESGKRKPFANATAAARSDRAGPFSDRYFRPGMILGSRIPVRDN
jgi:hypothetical protein